MFATFKTTKKSKLEKCPPRIKLIQSITITRVILIRFKHIQYKATKKQIVEPELTDFM